MNEPSEATVCSPSLVNRLRGIYTVPVNDGAGLLNGSDTFTRRFDGLPPINEEAAKRIEQLEGELERAKDELSVTIGALRRSAESAVALKSLLSKSAKVWSYAAVSVNGGLWREIQDVLREDPDDDDWTIE